MVPSQLQTPEVDDWRLSKSTSAPTTRENSVALQPKTSLPALVDPMHKIRPGDVLGIFVPGVFDEIDSKFSGTVSGYPIHVKSDGRISLPIAGRLKVAGKTVLEIEHDVKKKYVDGTEPIIREQDRDTISVVVQQVYEPLTRANSDRGLPSLVDPLHQVKAGDVLSIFVPTVFEGRNRVPSDPGYPIYVKSDGQISLPLIGRLKVTGKTALEIEDEVKKKYADGPNPIFEEEYRDSISVVVQQIYKPSSPTNAGRGKTTNSSLLGQWKVVSIEGKGGRFMTLDDSTRVGDTLMIPHYELLKRVGNNRELVVKRRWLSDEIKARWTKNDSLFIRMGGREMTYRSKNGDKKQVNDPKDPLEFAIYKKAGDELTIVAGDPNDFTIEEGKISNPRYTGDNSDEPEKLNLWRMIPNYAKDFLLPPGERQLWVKLRRVDPTSPQAVPFVENADAIRPFPVGNQPPASALAPYALRYEGGSKTPSSLLKRGKPNADGFPSYDFCAAAEPVEQLQGRWQAKKISVEGKEVALDSALAKKLQMSELFVDGQLMLGAKPDRREFYLLAYPDISEAAILVEVDDQTKTSLLRFSLAGDSLKLAINDTYNQLDPPQLKPNDDVIYIEYERAPADPDEVDVASTEPTSLTTPTVSDSAAKSTWPQRTKHGLVYRDDDQKSPYAVAVSASGETATVVIVDANRIKPTADSSVTVRADSLTVTASEDGPSAETSFVLPAIDDETSFVLPAIDTDKKGHSSVFHLENPSLVQALTNGSLYDQL